MADQSNDHQMEGVEEVIEKGKGKAPQAATVEEPLDEDSSDESGADEPGDVAEAEPEDEDAMEEIDTSNIVGRRTRGKNIDYAKAAEELGDDEDDEDDDEDYNDPDDAMQE